MKDLLKKYEDKQPEIVFNWKDPETEAEGWTVINSLRGGGFVIGKNNGSQVYSIWTCNWWCKIWNQF
jgi:hypothetical protein